ncbi:MAG: hypothetical protein WAL75_13480 [Terracidiphilus sp.]
MLHRFWGLGIAAALALATIFAIATYAEAQSTPPTSAYVYVQIQGPEGAVYRFNSSSTGQLSTIAGSPWKVSGEIVGSTPTKFFTLGKDLIHSYALGSNGSIGSQLSQMPVFDNAGSGCGGGTNGQDGAVLDHTGKFIYLLLQGGDEECAAYQSYAINSDGSFTFIGDTELPGAPLGYSAGLPSIMGNESFAYADFRIAGLKPSIIGFRRESSGQLELMQFRETDPTCSGGFYTPQHPDASPVGNYMAIQLFRQNSNTPQLGMYTVDSEGNLSTTNTGPEIQWSPFDNPSTVFSPSGAFLVDYAPEVGNTVGGLQAYKTQGAGPIYPYLISWGEDIEQVAWDNSNHLYDISNRFSRLEVSTLTPTSYNYGAGSTVTIGSPYKMVVVSK